MDIHVKATPHIFLRYHKIYEKISLITSIWPSQILFYHCHDQQPMDSDHGTQYEENLAIYHGGMCEAK